MGFNECIAAERAIRGASAGSLLQTSDHVVEAGHLHAARHQVHLQSAAKGEGWLSVMQFRNTVCGAQRQPACFLLGCCLLAACR